MKTKEKFNINNLNKNSDMTKLAKYLNDPDCGSVNLQVDGGNLDTRAELFAALLNLGWKRCDTNFGFTNKGSVASMKKASWGWVVNCIATNFMGAFLQVEKQENKH